MPAVRQRPGSNRSGRGQSIPRGETSGRISVRAVAKKTKTKAKENSAPVAPMAKVPRFDAQAFLMSVGTGRSTRKYRQGGKAGHGNSTDQPGRPSGERRDDPAADKLLHEQVPQAGADRIQ